ncbi:transferrin-like isoform X2 [Leguminivora glycinivorella]|uniref:transferrin-like isoform X2 n=1 Tax=Leguminivora glycinivorella TaxID=1035111 RepID=UPI00200C15F4|nr:transferrin-like isoform X2 [Leguminivora glycinivorella]
MALRSFILLSLLASVFAQDRYRVCVSSTSQCQALELGDSRAICTPVESRVDCALQLVRGTADVGFFTDEELLVLGQTQPTNNLVIATVRDFTKPGSVSFQSVAVVRNDHTNGLEGLRGKKYCHPGLGEAALRWSPRVEKELETRAANTDRCPEADYKFKTAEEMEVETLSQFFGDSCRPGAWSANATVDADLKRRYPSLCALCGPNSSCDYTIDMGITIAGINNNNAHIKALECLRSGGDVTYVAWQHVREFFTIRNNDIVSNFSLLCPNGTLVGLNSVNITDTNAPCAFVSQHWGGIVANSARANALQTELRTWWPAGSNPADNTWRSTLYSILVPQSSNAQVIMEDTLLTPANFTQLSRPLTSIDSATSCVPPRVWCVVSAQELAKCNWVRAAAYSLGIKPSISCVQRSDIFQCLRDVREKNVDFIATSSNYGYLARQHFSLTPVKLVQNLHSDPNSFSRVIALVRANSDITRFENLRGRKACFPEFGGISYMSFVRTAQVLGVLNDKECDYARAVGEFFSTTCAPGAQDASHALGASNYDVSNLCSLCKAPNGANSTCSWDYTSNLYFGNNGSLSCLANNDADIIFVETTNINSYLTAQNLQASQFRALCSNNTLALQNGVNVDDNCLLSYVVDSEVLTRRQDEAYSSISALLDTLEKYFGYTASSGTQHVNLEIFSSFDGTRDLLFKNTAVGFSEPTTATTNQPAKNYIELFSHLQACTGAGNNIPVPGLANRSFYSIVTLIVSALVTRFIVY